MRRTLAGLAVAGAMVALVGCSSSGSSSTETSPSASATTSASATSTTPEDQRTSAAAVAVGLKAIDKLSARIAAAPALQGKALSEGIEPLWKPIEGTVKANDPNTYLALEDAFALLESGETAKAQQGATAVSTATTEYLAKYPA